MPEALLILILFGSLALAWQDALRAREIALRKCAQICTNAGLQLLDQSVSLRRLNLKRGSSGWLGLRRQYAFEVSSDGHDRHRGSLRLFEGRVQDYSLPLLPTELESIRPSVLH